MCVGQLARKLADETSAFREVSKAKMERIEKFRPEVVIWMPNSPASGILVLRVRESVNLKNSTSQHEEERNDDR